MDEQERRREGRKEKREEAPGGGKEAAPPQTEPYLLVPYFFDAINSLLNHHSDKAPVCSHFTLSRQEQFLYIEFLFRRKLGRPAFNDHNFSAKCCDEAKKKTRI